MAPTRLCKWSDGSFALEGDAQRLIDIIAGPGAWDQWQQDGNLIIPEMFKWLWEGVGSESDAGDLIDLEFDIYRYHQPQRNGIPNTLPDTAISAPRFFVLDELCRDEAWTNPRSHYLAYGHSMFNMNSLPTSSKSETGTVYSTKLPTGEFVICKPTPFNHTEAIEAAIKSLPLFIERWNKGERVCHLTISSLRV